MFSLNLRQKFFMNEDNQKLKYYLVFHEVEQIFAYMTKKVGSSVN